ncbi:hypothetical protein DYI41_20725, partial [Marinobacter salarius]|uniref:hypothetical protein n=1 Tax=Marinobacter salarius TaxID=1420917 RepID=UPI001BCCBFC4
GRSVAEVRFVPAWSGWLALENADSIEKASLLTREARLRDLDSGAEFVHHPRGLYVFPKDELSQPYVERDRVSLGADSLILTLERLKSETSSLLGVVARPGYKEYSAGQLEGLPENWIAYAGVQVMTVPKSTEQSQKELSALVPAVVTQLS